MWTRIVYEGVYFFKSLSNEIKECASTNMFKTKFNNNITISIIIKNFYHLNISKKKCFI